MFYPTVDGNPQCLAKRSQVQPGLSQNDGGNATIPIHALQPIHCTVLCLVVASGKAHVLPPPLGPGSCMLRGWSAVTKGLVTCTVTVAP